MKNILHTFFETNDVPMLLCNLEWDVLFANTKAKQILGIENEPCSLFNHGIFGENDIQTDWVVELLNRDIASKNMPFQSADLKKNYNAKVELIAYNNLDYLAIYLQESSPLTFASNTVNFKENLQLDFTKPVILKSGSGLQTIQSFVAHLGFVLSSDTDVNTFLYSKIKFASFIEDENEDDNMVYYKFSIQDATGKIHWYNTLKKPKNGLMGNKPYNILHEAETPSDLIEYTSTSSNNNFLSHFPDYYFSYDISSKQILFVNKSKGFLDYSNEEWVNGLVLGVDNANTATFKSFIDRIIHLKDNELTVADVYVADKNQYEDHHLLLKGKKAIIDEKQIALISVVNLYDALLPNVNLSNNSSFIPDSFLSASIPMALCTLKFEFVKLNKSAERILNYKSEELEGKTLSHISFENEMSFDIRQFHKLIKREIDSYTINRTYKGKGVLVEGAINASVVTLNGQDYILGILLENKKDTNKDFTQNDSFSIFNSILAINPDIHFIFDVDKRSMIYENISFLNYLGYTKEDLNGLDILDFFSGILAVNPEVRANLINCIIAKDFEENKYKTVEFYIRAKSGELKYFRLRGTVLLNDANNFLNYGILQDLTKQKQTEDALSEQENLNNLVANLIPDFLIVSNIETLEHVHTNFNGRTLLGYTEFDWNRLRNIKIDPEFESQVKKQIASLRDLTDGELLMSEVKLIDSNNQSKWVSLKSKVLKRNAKTREVELVLTIAADIDDKKKTLENLVLSENKNKALITAIPDLILVVSKDGVYTQAVSGHDLTITENNGIVGAKVHDVIKDENIANEIVQNVKDSIELNEVRLFEFRYDDIEDECYYSNYFSKLNDNEAIVLVRNISTRKRMEIQLAEKVNLLSVQNNRLEQYISKNTELERFAYIVSHDLKEPLRSITAFSEILKEKLKALNDPKLDELTNYLTDGAHRMNHTIEGVLKYSRLDRLNETFEEVNVNEVLQHVIKDLDFLVKEKNGQIIAKELLSVVGHEIQIRQLFQNLINNGLKFNKSKKPKVEVGCEELDGHNWFYVKDNGIGIAEQNRESVFIMFKRLHSNKEYQGQGIGLSICKKIVDRHEGQIKIESNDWGGTTFLFTLGIN